MINKKEIFLLSLTFFLTIVCWVIYDLLTMKYKSVTTENFGKILTIKSKLNSEIINWLEKKED